MTETDLPMGSKRGTAELASSYVRMRAFQENRARKLLELVAARPGEIALDIGCGTGEQTCDLARRLLPGGALVAIDPDPSRLDIARQNAADQWLEIEFIQARGEDLRGFETDRFDFIYSSYSVHWITDMPAFLAETYRVLKSGGRMVFECVGEPVHKIVELLAMMPSFDEIMQENTFQSDEIWREQISAAGFSIELFDWPVLELEFADVGAMLEWTEATSHGAFRRDLLSGEQMAEIRQQYPADVVIPFQALRGLLWK
ncbi:MAG: methyltransferase domain-containing protein [Roseibium sp.]|uniref:class I SAM-dependent methyltransferase n=1 Tax=Roseibium sp. TaxID=1936156 RepID=UPI002623C363|nr:class I SAM-dependent methyltransferase [Roseibium sp.]MCV0428781.1 methyltransferase domain-containing protein [Roseibium sp.]